MNGRFGKSVSDSVSRVNGRGQAKALEQSEPKPVEWYGGFSDFGMRPEERQSLFDLGASKRLSKSARTVIRNTLICLVVAAGGAGIAVASL